MAIGDERPARIVLEAPSEQLAEDLREAMRMMRKFSRDAKHALTPSSSTANLFSWDSKIADLLEKERDKQEERDRKRNEEWRKQSSKRGSAVARIGVGFLEKAGSALFDQAAQGLDEVVNLERSLTRFQISGSASTSQMTDLRAALKDVAKETGIARSELLGGAHEFLTLTGDSKAAASSIGLFASVANASGADMKDIARSAAALQQNLKVDPKDFEEAFGALIVQGKAGTVEINNLAQELAGVAPQFSAFAGGTGLKGLYTLGAALQAGAKEFGTVSEAATGLRAMMVALSRNADKFKRSNVKIFNVDKNGKKTFRDFLMIFDDISKSRLAKEPTLLTKAFGSDEAKRFYDAMVRNRDLLNELRSQSGVGIVKTDALTYQQAPVGRLEASMQRLKIAAADAFTPERVAAFAWVIEGAASGLGKLVSFLQDVKAFIDNEKAKDEARNAVTRDQVIRKATMDEKERRKRAPEREKQLASFDRVAQNLPPKQRAQFYKNAAATMFKGDRWNIGTGQLLLQRGGMSQDEAMAIAEKERQRWAKGGNNPLYSPGGATQMNLWAAKAMSMMPLQSQASAIPPAPLPTNSIFLVVDGQVLAKSVANAKDARRKPGGR